jgi:hypothetical protein
MVAFTPWTESLRPDWLELIATGDAKLGFGGIFHPHLFNRLRKPHSDYASYQQHHKPPARPLLAKGHSCTVELQLYGTSEGTERRKLL